MTEIITQWKHKDCSLASVMNCYILNSWINAHRLSQNVANVYFEEYEAKSPIQAVYFLKEKGFDVKYINFSYAKAKIRLAKWFTLVCQMKYSYDWWINLAEDMVENWRDNTHPNPSQKHFFCMKQEWDKMYIYDSNFPKRYEITDWERFYKEWIISNNFYQIK